MRHLEIEVLLALLFGERIGVTGAYSFDSSGFLEVAAKLVRNGANLSGVGRRPILLGLLPDMGTFQEYVARQVGRPKKEFVLSGWQSISDDQQRRDEFARLFLSPDPDPGQIIQLLGRRFEQERVEDLLVLASYFDRSTVTIARAPQFPLVAYVDRLQELRLETFPLEEQDAVAALMSGVRKLRIGGVNLDNRSDVRVQRSQIEQWVGADVYNGLLEFVDTCYNQVLHDSLGTRAGVFSSRLTENHGLGVIGERLAYMVRDELLRQQGKPSRSALSLRIAPDAELVPIGSGADELLRKSPQVKWGDVLELIASRDFRDSIDRLKGAQSTGPLNAVEHWRVKHIGLIEPVVRPYKLIPEEYGVRLSLKPPEYKFDAVKAKLAAVTVAAEALLEYVISGQVGVLGPAVSLLGVEMAMTMVRASNPVSSGESPREITGTIETLKRSVRIEGE